MRLACLALVTLLPLAAQQDTNTVKAYVPLLTPIDWVHPVVPDEAKETPGMVNVLVTIDAIGKVTQAEALSGPKPLRQPALDAVKQQQYHPVFRDGQPVTAYTSAMVNFFVKDKSSAAGMDFGEQGAAQERLSALALRFPRSPEQVLADREDQTRELSGKDRFYALADLAKSAFTANVPKKASAYAHELLSAAPQYSKDWNYGNAIHDSNMVLGLVSARQGDVTAAKKFLLDAGSTPGSPQLNSFGPDMALAKALLEAGERDTVIEYLSRCRAFWKLGTARLDMWIAAIRGGGTPDFSMSLRMAH